MCNTDPNNTKAGKEYEVKPQYEELSKQLNMQHAIINAMKCMRAIKRNDDASLTRYSRNLKCATSDFLILALRLVYETTTLYFYATNS
ncbi:tetratricopeptide repeat protein 38 [Dorcoceras hygrometricum]|uniref:Tetratricopeptide repeat protein 38 n=1 Tax=Dorcoceras hygrometricum TaxID=472368 RepID=A0A2Z7C6R2_9LAMI|nr:tetratricopeptide repeat protein 38 [Dorcoceras hygrometricum]